MGDGVDGGGGDCGGDERILRWVAVYVVVVV